MDFALLLLVTFFAATVQSAIGFGFGLIAVPTFLIVLNSVAAIQLVIIITLIMSCVHWPKLRGFASPLSTLRQKQIIISRCQQSGGASGLHGGGGS